jgi:hypothetical protein
MQTSQANNKADHCPETAIIPTRNPRRATGPRTELGKQTASCNATKHGIFAKAVLLKGESRCDYEDLLTGLRDAFQPVGRFEDLLVETLATTTWRKRRLLLAESAQIQMNTEFSDWDRVGRELKEAAYLDDTNGLVRYMDKLGVIQYCVRLLLGLQEQIERNGFDTEADEDILEKIYGSRDDTRFREDLYDFYLMCLGTANVSEEDRERKGLHSPERCKSEMLRKIKNEIHRLERYDKKQSSIEAEQAKLEVVSRNVPDDDNLDRLLRYEASLERSFDRTLNQLERVQRRRRGESIPPPITVNLSSQG